MVCPFLHADEPQINKVLWTPFVHSNFEYLPQIFNGIEVRQLARPRMNTYFISYEPFFYYFCHMFGTIILLKDPLLPAIEFTYHPLEPQLQYLPIHGTIHFSIYDVEFPCTRDGASIHIRK